MKIAFIIIGWIALVIARVPTSRKAIVRVAKEIQASWSTLKVYFVMLGIFATSLCLTGWLAATLLNPVLLAASASEELLALVDFGVPLAISYIVMRLWMRGSETRQKAVSLVTKKVYPICTVATLVLALIIAPLFFPTSESIAKGIRNGMTFASAFEKAIEALSSFSQ